MGRRQLEKPYLESVPSSEFGPILAVRRTLVAASVTVPASETCRNTLAVQQKKLPMEKNITAPARLGQGGHRGVEHACAEIPEFQIFRFSPAPAAHEILLIEPGRGMGRGIS